MQLNDYFVLFQIYEYVHRRSVTRRLIRKEVRSNKTFEWLSQMRFYFDPKQQDVLQQLTIHIANAQFHYGFEYLGVQERLVTTPLTDRSCTSVSLLVKYATC